MGQAMELHTETMSHWVTFKLQNETYGIDVMQVREVLRGSEISPVPGAPPFVLGCINLRGSAVAVVDTCNHFGLPPHRVDDTAHILLLETGEYAVGFLVGSIHGVVELSAAEIELALDASCSGCSRFISGRCNREGGSLLLVDANKMLSREELAELGGM